MADNLLIVPPPLLTPGDFSVAMPNPQVPSDATDLEIEINRAIEQGGGVIDLRGRTRFIDRNMEPFILAGDVDLEIIGGRLQVAPNVTTPLQFICPHGEPVAITAVVTENFVIPIGTPSGNTKATKITAPGHGLARGDLVKIIAEESIPGGSSPLRRVGEFQYVQWVDGDNLWFSGRLQDTYTTGRRLVKVDTGPRLKIDGLRMFSSPPRTDPCGFLTVRGFAWPDIVASFRGGTSYGLWISSCYGARFKVGAEDMLNMVDTDDAISGYGVQDQGSFSTGTIRAVNCRHAYTTVSIMAAVGDEAWKYGRSRGTICHDGVAQGCSSAAFDVHSEAIDCTIATVSTGNTRIGEDASGTGVELRGRGNRVMGAIDRFSNSGLQFHATTAGGCQDCEALDFSYWGAGDAIRANSTPNRIERARTVRGIWRCNNSRTVIVQNADLRIDGAIIQPWGSTSDLIGVLMVADGNVVIEDLTVDLSIWTGSNFRVVSFQAGSTGNSVIIRRVKFINVGGNQLHSIVDANSCVGSVAIEGIRSDVDPAAGDIANGGNLTSRSLDRSPSIPTWTAPVGTYVRSTAPAAGGRMGWTRTSGGVWKPSGGIDA